MVIELDGVTVRPDLVDRTLRIVAEADSHAYHTTKAAHQDDCQRFTLLGLAGWLVMRFSWEDVMLGPEYVRFALRQAALLRADRMA